ncbi:S8 family serine peptidase [Neolewinella lacunae]|uniref:S8 family serine peptidase n=1 Tax=Neolewinella lacunae TaxID=1517758 RepID=A0A923PL21_9BACT|nr:S8 family serine peptidase [Neolewinella lacunae]MBC6996015.1 S8 family serine peptidase [Neolewinella lacunae]MDN3633189.1 S8 family serine peptidase [Neolewinella lacunae]
MLKHLLLGALCLCWATTAIAQSAHYWTEEGKVALRASTTQFIITADAGSELARVRTADVKRYSSWPHKPYAVVEMASPMRPDAVAASLGLTPGAVQVSPGFSYSDGYTIFPTRTIVAKLKDKKDAAQLLDLMGQYGIKNVVRKDGIFRIELLDVTQAFAASNAVYESGLAEFAQPDFYAPIERYQDPLFSQQFQMNNTGQTLDGVTGTADADCNALEAWGLTLGSSSITVAVIDDGLEAHEDFVTSTGASRYTAGFSPANNGNGNAVSGSAHGVSCAGSIAASHNNIGVMGVAPLVNLISVNIFVGGESTQDIADGITWAKNQGADVLSNSWGYTSCTANFTNINNALADANSNGRGGLGAVVVFASGNGYKNCVDYPAKNVNVIAVGAFSNQGIRSAYSNYGTDLDIMAPSNNVGGPGAGVRTTDRMGSPGYGSGNYTNNFGGTSSACPVVAGVAALVLGFNPNLTSTQVKDLLYSTAIDMGPAGDDLEYANGRVNALGAIQNAGGGGGGPTCTDGVQNGQETGIDCGGPSCPACPPVGCNGTEVTLTITLDNYPEETSWRIANDAGQIVASGGTYGSSPDGSTINETICLADDCYTFTILDSYGDGICCSYGNGSYTLRRGTTVLASGGSFGSSQATDFCIGGPGPDTTPPTTPTGLTASNITDVSVSLSWNASSDNVGVVSYNVFSSGTLLGTVTGTAATVNGLTACTNYSFTVSANDAAGNASATSNAAAVTTTGCTGGGGELGAYFFETGLQGWIDGGGDVARVSTSAYSYEGNFSVRIRDNSGTASAMTSPVLNLSGLASVELTFYFYARSMENGEDFWVRFNGGSGWQTVATYAAGSSFSNNGFYTATVTLPASSFNLGSSSQFRFQCDASDNSDEIYIDQVTVTGFTVAQATTGAGAITSISEVATHRRSGEPASLDDELMLSPNPATDHVRVYAGDPIQEITVFTIDGKRLLHHTYDNIERVTLDVSTLPTGVYLISILTDEEVSTERIVIRR